MNIKLIVALGFLLTSVFIGWCCYDYGYTQARTQQIDNYESMIRELKAESDQALERERKSYKKQDQLLRGLSYGLLHSIAITYRSSRDVGCYSCWIQSCTERARA